jgi:hypothetical protein
MYTNNEQAEKEIRKIIPFTVVSKKYLGINLTKEVKDFYNENYKTLKKESEDTKRWKDFPCLWISRINTVKMAILPKEIYRFTVIPIKIPMSFFREIEKSTVKLIWKHKRTLSIQSNPEKKSNAGCITIPDFKLYYTAIITKTAWYWHKSRHVPME